MGELDGLVIMVAQEQRRLNRGYQRREVWSGADKVTSWLQQLDKLVVDKERQSQMRRKELSMVGEDRDVKEYRLQHVFNVSNLLARIGSLYQI